MGGRGGAGGGLGAGEAGRGRGMSLAKFLSQEDINRANAASVTDMGDIIRRTFERNAAEINGLALSDSEKKDAVRKMAELATTALKTAAGKPAAQRIGPQERVAKWMGICVNYATSPVQTARRQRKRRFQMLLYLRQGLAHWRLR